MQERGLSAQGLEAPGGSSLSDAVAPGGWFGGCPTHTRPKAQASRGHLAEQRELLAHLRRMTRELAAYSAAASVARHANAGMPGASPPVGLSLSGEPDLAGIRERLLWVQLTMAQAQLLAAFDDARSSGYVEGSRHMQVLQQAERTQRRCDALWRRQQRRDQPVALRVPH